jgi:hypothetical protein
MDKQIEEMSKIICKDGANNGDCDKCGFHRKCSKFKVAEKLYNAGYRKIEEGAVVQHFEAEIEALEFELSQSNKLIKTIRKETAEKFAERLKEMAYQSTDWSHGEHPMVVEVDYIDEILEEITEGKGNENG